MVKEDAEKMDQLRELGELSLYINFHMDDNAITWKWYPIIYDMASRTMLKEDAEKMDQLRELGEHTTCVQNHEDGSGEYIMFK